MCRTEVNASSHFRAECGHGCLNERLRVAGVHGEAVADLIQVVDCDAGGLVVAVGDADGVDPSVQELLGLLEESSGKNWRAHRVFEKTG